MIAFVSIYLYIPCYNYLIFSHIQTLMAYLTFFMSIIPVIQSMIVFFNTLKFGVTLTLGNLMALGRSVSLAEKLNKLLCIVLRDSKVH